jgi:hypothetical protein
MPVPPTHANHCIYHFTHIDNLPRLLKTGFLCNNHPDLRHRLVPAALGFRNRDWETTAFRY